LIKLIFYVNVSKFIDYSSVNSEHGYRKRRRVVSEQAEIEDRLESLIIRVGDKTSSSLESNLEGLASVLEADLNTYKSKILRILSECPIQMPEKCSIYSTLVGLLNAKNYNFGGEVSIFKILSHSECCYYIMFKVCRANGSQSERSSA
jgi:nuclear cap-binding protein subunit 1